MRRSPCGALSSSRIRVAHSRTLGEVVGYALAQQAVALRPRTLRKTDRNVRAVGIWPASVAESGSYFLERSGSAARRPCAMRVGAITRTERSRYLGQKAPWGQMYCPGTLNQTADRGGRLHRHGRRLSGAMADQRRLLLRRLWSWTGPETASCIEHSSAGPPQAHWTPSNPISSNVCRIRRSSTWYMVDLDRMLARESQR